MAENFARLQGVDWYVYTSTGIGVYQPAEVFKEDDVWKTYPSENDKYAGWVKRLGELQLDCFETHYGLKKLLNSQTSKHLRRV